MQVTQTMSMSSSHTKHALEALHPPKVPAVRTAVRKKAGRELRERATPREVGDSSGGRKGDGGSRALTAGGEVGEQAERAAAGPEGG